MQNVTLEEALVAARKYHQAGNLAMADQTYRDILRAVPDHFPSIRYLGIIAYQKGNMKEALHFTGRATELEPGDAESWNNYAIMLSESNQEDGALKAWGKALAIRKNYAEAHSNRGHTLWRMGRYKESEQSCHKALKYKEKYPDALLNLGNALAAQGKTEEAIACWEKAKEVNPDFSKAYNNIGNALRDLGRIRESEEICRRALELDPENVQALNNLANALRDQGQSEEAEKLYRQATNLKPGYFEAHNNMAVSLMDQLRFDEAAVAARYAIAFKPDYAEAHGNLSVAMRELGKFSEAEIAARQAVELRPDSAESYMDLADVLFMGDRLDEAEAVLKKAQELQPDTPRIYMKLSAVLERSGRVEETLEAIDKAVKLNPEMPEAYHQKSLVYFMAGRMEEALAALDDALRLKPGFPAALATKAEILQSMGRMDEGRKMAIKGLEIKDNLPFLYFSISKVHKFTAEDPYFSKMKEMAENSTKFGRNQATALHFALFKAYEDVGEYEKAFDHLEKGNAIKRTAVPFDPEIQETVFSNITGTFIPEYIETFKGKGYGARVPVFILGMPRSGTTLTEQVISSHPEVFGAGELNELALAEQKYGPLTPETARAMGKGYVDMLRKYAPRARHITDKMPGNYFRIGQILTTLPQAKIIHCRRDPVDTGLSCYKQLFARGQYWSYDLKEIAVHYNYYQRLMAHWREVFPGRFLEIDYEETVADFENQARRLIDFIGLEWDEACLHPHRQERAILTASKAQVRKPVYKTAVRAWKRYEHRIGDLTGNLGPFLAPHKTR